MALIRKLPNVGRWLKKFRRSLGCALALRSSWCASLLSAPVPVRMRSYGRERGPGERLIVFLPGLGDVLEDYEFYGFIGAARAHGVTADMIVADMHFGYYVRRHMVERLRQDIILPARRKGCRQIDLVGISLGGFGALYYTMHHAGEITNLFLLAPYLGNESIIAEMTKTARVETERRRDAAADPEEHELWHWLKSHDAAGFPAIYLGYGLQDGFAAGNRLLAQSVPVSRVHAITGKHDWTTWSRLWKLLLPDIAAGSCLRPRADIDDLSAAS